MKKVVRSFILPCILFLVFYLGIPVYANVRNTDVSAARTGCILVSVDGKYIKADTDAIVKRINEIRLEACKEGIINENTGDPLTIDDYVPVKWSHKLQELAETRSAENMIETGHMRPNHILCPHETVDEDGAIVSEHEGKICQDNFYVSASLECCAMTAKGAISSVEYRNQTIMSYMDAIDKWYEEKDDLGGHYMEMINNDMDYIGMSVFQASDVRKDFLSDGFYTTAATSVLELTNKSWADAYEDDYLEKLSDSSATNLSGDYTQILEVSQKYLSAPMILTDNIREGSIDDPVKVYLGYLYYDNGDKTEYSHVHGLGNVTWTSSNPQIASIDQNGVITPKKSGTVTITAKTATASATKKITTEVYLYNKIYASNVTKTYTGKKQKISLKASCECKSKLSFYTSNKSVTVNRSTGKVTVKANYIGSAKITITSPDKGDYQGDIKIITIKILPSKTSLSAVKNKKGRKLLVQWKKNKIASGYQIQYSTDPKFQKSVKSKKVSAKTLKTTMTKLSKKTYYVRIRTYKTVSKKKYYSGWSQVKKIKIRK